MIDLFFAMIAATMNSADGQVAQEQTAQTPPAIITETAPEESPAPATATPSVSIAPGSVVVGQGVVIEGNAATPAPVAPAVADTGSFNMSVVPVGLVAEAQTPSGKFTTASEVKPILNATKGNWVAVRDYDGKDFLYVTHLWGWRCGLAAMAISVNDETMQNWPLPPCHTQFSTPNAMLEGDGNPYLTFKKGSVQSITIQVVYDDLTMDTARFERGNVLIP